MLNEQEQRDLLKIMFPKDDQGISFEEWEEFHHIVNFEKLSEEEQTSFFEKYAKKSITPFRDNKIEFEITKLLLDKFPSLAVKDIQINPTYSCIFDLWTANACDEPKTKSVLIDFVKKHADEDSIFAKICGHACYLTDNEEIIQLAALDNEKFCEKLAKACLEEKNQESRAKYPYSLLVFDDVPWITPEATRRSYATRVAKVAIKAAGRCPTALNTKFTNDNCGKKTVLQFAFDDMKHLLGQENSDIVRIKSIRDKLPTKKDRADFDKLVLKHDPYASMFVQIEDKHPDLLDVKNENGISLAEELGFDRPISNINMNLK